MFATRLSKDLLSCPKYTVSDKLEKMFVKEYKRTDISVDYLTL
jgi:hypothetical protein